MKASLRIKHSAAYVLAMGFLFVTGCGLIDSSDTKNIFREDDTTRRHEATAEESLWTIAMGGCTGHLLSPDIMMTAHHCAPAVGRRYTSGSAIIRGASNDITVAQVIEDYPAPLDFAILKISWAGGKMPSDQKFPPLIATKPTDVAMKPIQSVGDELFTVGFPVDKASTWGATYSQGNVQQTSGTYLVYDMGIINGNSGGGAWLKKNNMLVALTNGGPQAFQEQGWNTGSIKDPSLWNFGTAMFNAYPNSRTLQDIFPNGKNRFGGTTVAGDTNGQSLNVALEAVGDTSFKLHVSSTQKVAKVVTCQVTAEKCKIDANGYRESVLLKTRGNVQIYNAIPTTKIIDGQVYGIVAYDASGKAVAQRSIKIRQRSAGESFGLGAAPNADMSYSTIDATLKSWSEKGLSVTKMGYFGTGTHKTPYIKVGSNPTAPKVLVTASTHGNERISTTTVLGLAHTFLSQYGSDDEITQLIDSRTFYFVPMACADGYNANSREVDGGRDPNRSFPQPNAGGSSSTGCAQAIEQFFLSEKFDATIDYHASGRMIMYPWSYKRSPIEVESEDAGYRTLASKMAKTNNYRWGQIPAVVGYEAPGSSGDFFHWKSRANGFKTTSMAVEVGLSFSAASATAIAEEIRLNLPAFKIFAKSAPGMFGGTYGYESIPEEAPMAPTYSDLPAGFVAGFE